jgi:Tol biopolymer transport system component
MRAGLAAAALLAALATGCGDHGPGPGTIVFQSDRGGRDALYAVHPDGSGLTKLPFGDGVDVYWTRDGTRALVSYTTGSGAEVSYVFEPASRSRRTLRLPAVLQIGTWSPDGTRLVLSTNEGADILDVKTGKRVRLNAEGAEDLPTWSSDGKRLLFYSALDLYSAPADGRPATRLMGLGRIHPHIPAWADTIYGAQWSADGRWISFFDEGLYVVRSDGAGRLLLNRAADSAGWSPTGERLAFPTKAGIVLVDLETGRRRQLTREHLGDDERIGPVWSPDGDRVLYLRNDLGFGAYSGCHDQLWTVKADGTENRRVTSAFPDDGGIANASPVWVEATLNGTPAPKLPVVTFLGGHTITTRLPIIGLGAEGNRAVVPQGGIDDGPLGSIVVWNRAKKRQTEIPVSGCGSAYDVVLVAEVVGYRCNNASEGYTVHDALRLGGTSIVRTHGEEFSGAFLGGILANRGTVAYDILSQTVDTETFRFHRTTRIWESLGGRTEIVRTFRGEVDLLSLDDGRLAVLPVPCGTARYCGSGTTVSVFSAGGRIRTFALDGRPVLDAALDGPRLVVLQRKRLTVIDLGTGHRLAAWPVRRGFGRAANLQDAQRGLVAYVIGVAIHVLRLSDGREIVIDTPNATEPSFARFVPSGLFYSFNESYASRPGRLVFVTRDEVQRALASTAAVP